MDFLESIFLKGLPEQLHQTRFRQAQLLLNEALKQNRYVERNWLKLQNQPVKSMNSYDRLI
ncbi:hypothetical protein BO224_06270 [Erysipelotrichaceae bacterium NYU-BL-E8]|nr:hypothetical protein BO224_06270 [Erysipelotrichaceae bacterium NYU-BL-E8]